MSERQRQALHGSRPAERLTRHPQLQRMWGASAALAGQSPCLSSLSWSRARPAVLTDMDWHAKNETAPRQDAARTRMPSTFSGSVIQQAAELTERNKAVLPHGRVKQLKTASSCFGIRQVEHARASRCRVLPCQHLVSILCVGAWLRWCLCGLQWHLLEWSKDS